MNATLSAVEQVLDEHSANLVAFRRQLHAHPELSGEEYATTEAVLTQLSALGLRPVRLRCGTGLVCDIGAGDPVVALRADIDALAMPDGKEVSYRSLVNGVAHACGHDVHTTVLLGVAMALLRVLTGSAVTGTVRLIFEPSEESVPGGAVDVVAEGWLDGVAAIFGLHCDPKLDVGLVAVRPGAITSAADLVQIRLKGPGGHTARPHLTVDLLGAMGRILTEVPVRLEARRPGSLRLVFGSAHAGDAGNVIPAEGLVRGTLRTPDRDAWALAPGLVEEAVADALEGTGATWEIEHHRGVPPVVNDPAATDVVAACARQALGKHAVAVAEHSWGGDSFSWYTEKVPGSYFRLGVHATAPAGPRLDLHASTFDVDEAAIGHGVKVLAATAVAMLDQLTTTTESAD
ncbi:MAG TPA: amidohydrolase [Pedococcus sp.]|nr:amidohydrolase [Pedococcus sp.]